MKSNRGITLTSLVIYIIGLTIVISIVGTFTNYFNRNINEVTIKQNAEEEYSKLLAFLTKDVNSDNLVYVESGKNGIDCAIFKFSDGIEHQYILQNQIIYYLNVENQNEKKIVLCENVTASKVFEYSDKILNVNYKVNEKDFSISLNIKNIE